MQLYWGLKSIPELAGLPTAERRRVWRAGHWKAYRHWQTWAAMAGAGLFSGFSAYLSLLIDPSTISVVIGSAIGAGLGGAAYGQLFTEFARPYLRTFPVVQPLDSEPSP